MKRILILLTIATLFLGCGGDNKLKVSGTLTKHSKDGRNYFTIKDDKTNKLYRIAKKSETALEDKEGHKIKMAIKVLEKDTSAEGVDTVMSCTKCHHSIKDLS